MPFCSSSLSKYQTPQILAKISEWFSEVESDPGEESVLSTLCWEEQAVCDELLCGWLPPTMKYVKGAHSCHLGASWIKNQGSCAQVGTQSQFSWTLSFHVLLVRISKQWLIQELSYSFLDTWNAFKAGKIGSTDLLTVSPVPIPFQL